MSGLKLLYNFILKEVVKRSGKASGILSIGSDVRKLADKKFQSYVMTAKAKGVDLDKLSEQEIKYMLELNKPKGPMIGEHRVIDATSSEGKKITEKLFGKKGEVVKVDFDPSGKQTFKGMSEGVEDVSFKPGMDPKGKIVAESPSQIIVRMKAMTPMDAMKEANKVLKGEGRYKSLSKADRKKIVDDESVTDHIFERNIEPDPEDFAHGGRTGTGLNYLLGEDDQNMRVPYSKGSRKKESWRDKLTRWGGGPSMIAGDLGFEGLNQIYQLLGMGGLYAEGGRTGFGLGGMTRRAFLKIMGGTAAGVGVAKSGLFSLLKSGKPVSKVLTQVPIKAGVDGMPVWFKPLVNKVIKEGDDVSKRFATQERQVVHQSTLPDSKTDIIVTQNLDTGNVAVDIGLTKHGFADGKFGQPVRLEYKAGEWIETPIVKEGKLVKGHGKGAKTKEEFWVEEAEFTGGHPENVKFEDSTFSKFGKHESDFSEVEAFSKGKTKKVRLKQFESSQKEAEDLADHFSNYPKPDDFASGGRVPFAGGNGVADKEAENAVFAKRVRELMDDGFDMGEAVRQAMKEGYAEGGRVPLVKGKIVKGIMSLGKKKKKKIDDLGGSKVDPFSKDFDFKAEADLIAKTPYTASELKLLIIEKYKGRIDDKLLKQMLVDDNPQRLAEVMATVDEALIMQQKGMGHETIMQSFKDSWKRKKNASGGIAGMLGE